MTPDQVKAIQESFAKVVPISQQASAMFYGRLFEIAPSVKPLFRGDIEEQGLPAASALAKRHIDYGVKATDYESVGAALLWTLERGLGPQWTAELKAAWTEAYTVLADFMIAEAYGGRAAAE